MKINDFTWGTGAQLCQVPLVRAFFVKTNENQYDDDADPLTLRARPYVDLSTTSLVRPDGMGGMSG